MQFNLYRARQSANSTSADVANFIQAIYFIEAGAAVNEFTNHASRGVCATGDQREQNAINSSVCPHRCLVYRCGAYDVTSRSLEKIKFIARQMRDDEATTERFLVAKTATRRARVKLLKERRAGGVHQACALDAPPSIPSTDTDDDSLREVRPPEQHGCSRPSKPGQFQVTFSYISFSWEIISLRSFLFMYKTLNLTDAVIVVFP